MVSDSALVPIGTIISYVGKKSTLKRVADEGWLVCDGRPMIVDSYPHLYNAIGTAFGGDGLKFNLPDLRGRFLRGVAEESGQDPDLADRTAQADHGNTGSTPDTVGSRQADGVRKHEHHWNGNFANIGNDGNNISVQLADNSWGNMGSQPTTDVDGGGNETRPANVSVYYLILGDKPRGAQPPE